MRGDGYRAGSIIKLQKKLVGEHKGVNELHKEWITEVRQLLSEGDWATKGESSCEEFLARYFDKKETTEL